jgi:dienelactone hydrolase
MGLRTLRRVFLIVCAGVVLAAMVAVMPATATAGGLQLTVTPKVSAADTPLTIRVRGLTPGQTVTLSVSSVDANGVTWSSSSTYTAGPAGTVDPVTTPAVAGSYTGVDAMGPVDMMTGAPDSAPPDSVGVTTSAGCPFGTSSLYPDDWYAWASCPSAPQGWHGCWWVKPLPFVFSVTAGEANASTTVWRGPASPVTASPESVAGTGFYGVFWQPPAGLDNHIGVLELAGGMGGIDASLGALLAARGYPTLDLAYFDSPDQDLPGVPPFSWEPQIPLEYFANALHWLGSQPGVNRARLWVVGWSLGTEAALLTGAHFPNLVHGVVAFSPNDAATCQDATWTLAGQPLPCTNYEGAPQQTDNPAAIIPVAQIRGPIEFVCGEQDTVWPSCPNSEAMMAELAAAHDAYPHRLVEYPDAGHGVGIFAPYTPGLAPIEGTDGIGGDTPIANPVARADQWPKLLAFLRN